MNETEKRILKLAQSGGDIHGYHVEFRKDDEYAAALNLLNRGMLREGTPTGRGMFVFPRHSQYPRRA